MLIFSTPPVPTVLNRRISDPGRPGSSRGSPLPLSPGIQALEARTLETQGPRNTGPRNPDPKQGPRNTGPGNTGGVKRES